MSADTLKLANGFDAPTQDQWRGVVDKALKGGDFEKRLVARTADDIRIQPLYGRRENAEAIAGETAGRPWRISARVDHPDPRSANELALDDLRNGADSLNLVFPGSLSSRGYGIACQTLDQLEAALAGVTLEMIALRVDPGPLSRINAGLVAALIEKRGLDPAECSIDFGMDPVGNLAHRGMMAADWPTVSKRVADAAWCLKGKGFSGPFLNCDTRCYHEAGASPAQELGIALATGVAYLRILSETGWTGEDASRAISFSFAIDADQFMGIAKLRAMRRLWARVEEASGIDAQPIRINAESAWRMMTRRDAWVNMLRSTVATFTAGIGGADSMTVLPHTQVLGLPDGFARRVARNTQSVLLEESNLYRVADPAAGSGGYEALTDELAQAGWSLFQELEAESGIVASLKAGGIQSRIASKREASEKNVARRVEALTGTSEFPLLSEGALEVLDVKVDLDRGLAKPVDGSGDMDFAEIIAGLLAGKSRDEVTPGPGASLVAQALPSTRLGEPFEALRDAADAHKAKTGALPKVFLASLGPIAAHTGRSTWIRNLLGAGGIEAVVSDGYETAQEAADAFKASGTTVACICSSDDVYARTGAAAATALKEAGAAQVLLAGRPGDLETALSEAGVDGYVFAGQDVLELLGRLQGQLVAA
ncbi:MAG: methylmalonyl-CoA mutase subunit beta [Alphaproteobacteria bacterium]|nr:methylmalonyl-CoA mutase subunit beta [Alphaproteobacteria bacterium]